MSILSFAPQMRPLLTQHTPRLATALYQTNYNQLINRVFLATHKAGMHLDISNIGNR